MSAAQRISRGFHRLGLVLAAITFLIGASVAAVFVPDWNAPLSSPKWTVTGLGHPCKGHCDPLPEGWVYVGTLNIDGIGSFQVPDGFSKLAVADQQKTVDGFVVSNWRTKVAVPLAEALGAMLVFSLALYILVRAIGWVIGGFAT
jgi:hypothetical protein